jgi:hypothetical protein
MLARKALLLTTLLTGSAGTLSATPFWEQWTAHIPCSAFVQTCPEITLWSRSTVGVGSRIALTFRNPHNQTGSLLPWWNIAAYPHPFWWPDDFVAQGWYAEGRVASRYGSEGAAGFLPPINTGGVLSLTFTDGGSLLGCFPDLNSNPLYGYYSLCPQNGFGGSVTFFYDFSTRVTLPEITYISLAGAGYGTPTSAREFDYLPGAICNDNLACEYTLAPEPSTWALLGGGLALIAAVSVVRRRRQKAAA